MNVWYYKYNNIKGKTQLSSQIKFYKVMTVPVLMHGRENCFLNRSNKRKFEAAGMRFLRPMGGQKKVTT
jgi:hypothetical protein